MIRILYSPRGSEVDTSIYEINGEVIKAIINGVEDVFNFSLLPDGICKEIETSLSVNPIINAEREDGILYLELLNYIRDDASDFEKFPVWIEVE